MDDELIVARDEHVMGAAAHEALLRLIMRPKSPVETPMPIFGSQRQKRKSNP
jgi:hypothetical protein